MNKAQYKEKVRRGGCIICGMPGEIHHPRFCVGLAQKASDYLCICLCPYHHRTGNYGHSIHSGKATFEKNYGSEPELLARTIEKMMREV